MGRIVYAAAMSHVLNPDYYGKNVGPHGRRLVRPAYRLALTRLGAALIALGARLQAGTEAEQPIQQTANR